jgi:predicted oxidoreductase
MKLTGRHNFLSPEAGLVSDEVLRSPFVAWETRVIIAGRASLKRLGTDHIDLYQIHGNDAITPIEETLRALGSLVQQGQGPLRRRQ